MRLRRVYPRASGGTAVQRPHDVGAHGLSPRERGNRPTSVVARPISGSIPARAGEPAAARSRPLPLTVYPRASGGTESIAAAALPKVGLSPRERGNPLDLADASVDAGSIPARAGEPPGRCRCGWSRTVYPRASGGTSGAQYQTGSGSGLSPRERGNPLRLAAARPTERSIPARAGEPLPQGERVHVIPVYPRASGGTRPMCSCSLSVTGLSPRERGNR